MPSGNHGTRQRDALFQVDIKRHHLGFAQRIDRRVSDLRKPLLAVIPQGSRERGKKCGRRVVSHAPVRFFTVDQRGKKNFELIFGPASGARDAFALSNEGRRCGIWHGQHSLRNCVARLLNRETLEDVAPAQKEPGGGIGKDHFSGAKPLALSDSRFVQINQAGLGSRDQQPVMRQGVAQRAQSIAIQLRSHKLAVGKNQSSGAVPGFAALRKRGQRAAHVPREQRILFKGGRNHGKHGFLR